ncbi:MAG: hypothetical protein K2Q26_10105 [Bdellovibrionales bacterium]|nr:hypothetical protein [Bdellovibrionales bacterium]
MENNEVTETPKEKEEVELNWEDEGSRGKLSDGVKRLVATGISTVMMSEEGVRSFLQDKIPKDVLGNFLKGMTKSKEEIVNRVGAEFAKVIEKIDVVEEMTKFLRDNKIKASFEIEFEKKSKKNTDNQ